MLFTIIPTVVALSLGKQNKSLNTVLIDCHPFKFELEERERRVRQVIFFQKYYSNDSWLALLVRCSDQLVHPAAGLLHVFKWNVVKQRNSILFSVSKTSLTTEEKLQYTKREKLGEEQGYISP